MTKTGKAAVAFLAVAVLSLTICAGNSMQSTAALVGLAGFAIAFVGLAVAGGIGLVKLFLRRRTPSP